MAINYLDLVVAFSLISWLWKSYTHRQRSKGCPYPPGPQGLPVVGNMLDMPTSRQWLKAAEWRKNFGDIIYLEVLGRPIVFLNSYKTAFDLLDRRSAIYSSRPTFVMMNELQGWNWLTSNMPYGDRWRKHRALLHRFLEPSGAVKYVDLQTRDAHKLLAELLRKPDAFFSHVRNCIGSSIMRIAYGHDVKTENDPYITLADEGFTIMAEASDTSKYLVEVIPWLKYIPAWIPGAGFQTFAKKGYSLSMRMRNAPYYDMKEKILNGTAQSSILSELIEANLGEGGDVRDEETIANVTGIIYGAGADTSVSTILTFVLAMVLFPEAQQRAQKELDAVVGNERLPTLDDRPSLPFVEALFMECLRWQLVTPLAGAHTLTQDDIYNGYFLPEGTMILPNAWAMLHDPEEYPDPEAFKPERFLPFNEDGSPKKVPRDPAKSAFGFGRRMCPGRHLASNSIFIVISSILAAFNIKKATGKDGNPIEPTLEYVSSFISHPAAFECSIIPRSEKCVALISQTANF